MGQWSIHLGPEDENILGGNDSVGMIPQEAKDIMCFCEGIYL